jgi:hypothetical protein
MSAFMQLIFLGGYFVIAMLVAVQTHEASKRYASDHPNYSTSIPMATLTGALWPLSLAGIGAAVVFRGEGGIFIPSPPKEKV